MQVSVEASGNLERRMRVQVPAAMIDEKVAAKLKSVGRSAKIKGFRPGKVPAKVVQERYGAQVRQEVIQEVLETSFSQALQQENLNPAGGPRIEPESLEVGKDLSYTAIFEILPEFKVKGVDTIKVAQPQAVIAASDIEDMIQHLRKQRATWDPVPRAAAAGDQITIDFVGTRDGQPFAGGSGEGVPIVLGEGAMLEDFEKHLGGMAAAAVKEFNLTFPTDYHATDLAGVEVTFAVTATEVAERALPEVDAEFIKAYGVESGEIAALHADISASMLREVEGKVRAEVKRQAMEGLLEANPLDLPEVLVTREIGALRSDAMRRLGIKDPAQAPAEESFREAAARRVRLGLLISAVLEENGIELDRDRVNKTIDELCQPYQKPAEMRKMYLQNQQLMSQVANMVLEDQAVDWLIAQARVTSKELGFRDLMAL